MRFIVDHKILCEVVTRRVIEAKNYDEALTKVAEIQTITAVDDLEIVSDLNVLSMSIEAEE